MGANLVRRSLSGVLLAVLLAGVLTAVRSVAEPPGALVAALSRPTVGGAAPPRAAGRAGPPDQPVAPDQPVEPAFGMILGPDVGVEPADLRRRGVTTVLAEVFWDAAEPTPGRFDEGYLAFTRHQVQRLRAAGLGVVLNLGVYQAPAWVLARPGARPTDQDGRPWTATPQPDLVFDQALRPLAEAYLDRVFAELGTDFVAVRAGAGPNGETGYPGARDASTGAFASRYFAFSLAAQAVDPVPGWLPGQPSPHGEAARFYAWYVDSLVDVENWEVAAVRRHYAGPVPVLYPSYGLRPGDREAAVAGDLSGGTGAERNGEVSRGYDHARLVDGLTDPHSGVWGTWAEFPTTLEFLAGLARAKGLPLYAESSGNDSAAQLSDAVTQARRWHAALFLMWRADQAYCFCSGWATIDDYTRLIGGRGP